MNTKNRYSTVFVLGVALLAFSSTVWSLGLGDAKVDSFLSQPLAISVELIIGPDDALDDVSVGLASADDYELIGASRDDISVPLSFSVDGSADAAYILVSSELPVNNPVVRLILEVNWSKGRMLREYTLFLDPATFSSSAPAPTPTPQPSPANDGSANEGPANESPVNRSEPAATETTSESPESTVDTASAPATSQKQVQTGESEYGPVQSGETLWRIAKDWSAGSGLNLNKVMIAIQRNNPSAFSRNNINLLQRGAILRMPAIDQVESISSSAANSEVSEQTYEFENRQPISSASTPLLIDENAAPMPVTPEVAEEPGPAAPVAGAEEAVEEIAEEVAVEEAVEQTLDSITQSDPASLESELDAATAPEPQLELVPPSQDSALESAYGLEESEGDAEAVDSVSVLREELARKEEELINQQQQNTYLEQRLREMEGQLAESRENSVQDENLATMEERLREQRQAADRQAAANDKPWYSGLTLWVVALLVLIAVIVGWFMSRRSVAEDSPTDGSEALRDIAGDAEDVLRVLDSDAAGPAKTREATAVSAVSKESDTTVMAPVDGKSKVKRRDSEDDAKLLDEESADPEIQLDLARAYISMGDKEAARVILEEIMVHGNDEQKAEAEKMKGAL